MNSDQKKCPKCGAESSNHGHAHFKFVCGTVTRLDGSVVTKGGICKQISTLTAQLAAEREQRRKLGEYAKHKGWCRRVQPLGYLLKARCDCGLDDVRQAAATLAEIKNENNKSI